ncbi:unnamed protein product [Zymoseptoria tritici ST99CH_1A5]|uniref:Uncharacterized protein n=1 Tax=Zymoseptoria tritici ST99CH_1A5 TaxID=1276529 RepID=A0A1Y6LSD5_ZYMTR|nr:unnamed protein product [Zymoseptoria tritici ST99CH_1A5]
MSRVYILTQTSYIHWKDHANEENKDMEILEVYPTAKAANQAAKQWVEETLDDGENECEDYGDGDIWTCRLNRPNQSHVVVAVVAKDLMGDVEDSEEEDDEEEEEEGDSDDEEDGEPDGGLEEASEPPTKRARQA